jgi:hypothetical protein
VDQVTAKYWADHSQSPDEEKIDKAFRDQFHDDPSMLRAARAEFTSRVGDWNFTHQQQSNDAQQSAYKDIASGKSISYIQSQPYWSHMQGGDRLSVINAATGFADSRESHVAGAAGRAAGLNPDFVGYAVSKGMPEHIARAMAAVFSGETNNDPEAFNPTGGGQGALGLFQARGDLQRQMKQKFGDHPSWQQQIDFYSDLIGKTPQVTAAGNETDAVRAMVQFIQKPGKDTDALIARSLGALQKTGAGRQTDYDGQADALLADPSQIGPLTPQNVQRIQNMVGPKYAPHVIAAAQKWQRETTRAALPTAAELTSVLTDLHIPTGKTNDPKVLAQRAQVRASLQGVLLNEAKGGAIITDPTERADILQKAAATTVQVFHKGWISNTNADVPLLTISREDSGSITKTAFDNIPVEERSKVVRGLRKALGTMPSKIDVVRAYYQRQGYVIPK